MSTLFVALRCVQCSTMQVKRHRESGTKNNKWVCAVCNLRQSVRRVHARGPIARDLRGFVQEYNLSRAAHGSDGSDPIPILRSEGSRAPDGVGERGGDGGRHKRRMDWSEYLDPREEEEEEAGGGDEGGTESEKTHESKMHSKWSEYLGEEDTDEGFGGEVYYAERSGNYYEHSGGKENHLSHLLVEDEVHPDFK